MDKGVCEAVVELDKMLGNVDKVAEVLENVNGKMFRSRLRLVVIVGFLVIGLTGSFSVGEEVFVPIIAM